MTEYDPDRASRRSDGRWRLTAAFANAFSPGFGSIFAYIAGGVLVVLAVASVLGISFETALILGMVGLVALALLAAASG